MIRCPSLLQIILFFILTTTGGNVWAHGVGWAESEGQKRGIEFYYSDGSPLAYADIKVYAPDNPEISFQRGRSDKNGRFSFQPDHAGTWKVVISDGQGHQAEALLEIGPLDKIIEKDLSAAVEAPLSGGAQKPDAKTIVLGISIILNLALIIRFFTVKRGPSVLV